jgi:alanine-synthesizing transaminase
MCPSDHNIPPIHFAKRTEWDLTLNRLAQKRKEMEQAGIPILDLTESNPTRLGFSYPESILTAFSHPRGLRYEPAPKGLQQARDCVADWYSEKGFKVDPDQIVLTSGTSEAYAYLFKLFCEPNEAVLVPKPGYPLLDYLADLCDVRLVPYRLYWSDEQNRWVLDVESLQRAALTVPEVRVCVVVHPNNPTGSCLNGPERSVLIDLCLKHGWVLVVDEVFADYLDFGQSDTPSTWVGDATTPIICLGGLSKMMGLPQMKLGWMVVGGPPLFRSKALERLEVMADTFLSVNTLIQLALSDLKPAKHAIQDEIRRRIKANRQELKDLCGFTNSLRLLDGLGGWYAVLRLHGVVEDDETWAVDLLTTQRVLVHPGYLFDFEEAGYAAVSLLVPTDRLVEGIRRLLTGLGFQPSMRPI